jgi:alpha-mannosidase
VSLFDKALNRDVARDMEIVALEERGGNYIGIEPLSGRTIVGTAEEVSVEENNPVRAVVRVLVRVADIPVVQRLTLYSGLKRLDIENTVEWKTPRFIRLQQLFPLTQANASLHYGVPFGSNAAGNIMPKSGPRAGDEIKNDSWQRSRHIHGWIHAGGNEWGLTLASDHQQIRLGDDVIRAEMLRGTRYTSVKVVRGDEVTSMFYPPAGRYVFRYSLSSAPGDWKTAKSYRAGMNWTSPLAAVLVADRISAKSLPPTRSFCSVKQDNLVISALKKSDLDESLLLRVYEIEGSPVDSAIDFLGAAQSFGETNLLEEDLPGAPRQAVKAGPYAIRTLKLAAKPAR